MAKNNATVRLAVIGAGVMGANHLKEIATLPEARLTAVCDGDAQRAEAAAAQYGVKAFTGVQDLLDEADLDAVVIATPHYSHTPLSIAALQRGVHVLVEKPLAVHTADGRAMLDAYRAAKQLHPDLLFGIMFQMRTLPPWRKIKEMIDGGDLGRLVRATWIITDWFRTQYYYNLGGWRATWRGEGGGVLLNQCPHNLDLYQWFFGLPRKVTGFAAFGKYHRVEVEDEVSAFFEHENGMVGHFITTTAESPGANRLEIAGEKGKLVYEDGALSFYRNSRSMFEYIQNSPTLFDKVPYTIEALHPGEIEAPPHRQVLQAFLQAILTGGQPMISAAEGFNSLMLGNAILLSHLMKSPVTLPIDDDLYKHQLDGLIDAAGSGNSTSAPAR